MAAADDAQQERRTTHEGHVILVTATRGPAGYWTWSYLIDGGSHSVGKVPCRDAQAALRQGLNAAKARIQG